MEVLLVLASGFSIRNPQFHNPQFHIPTPNSEEPSSSINLRALKARLEPAVLDVSNNPTGVAVKRTMARQRKRQRIGPHGKFGSRKFHRESITIFGAASERGVDQSRPFQFSQSSKAPLSCTACVARLSSGNLSD